MAKYSKRKRSFKRKSGFKKAVKNIVKSEISKAVETKFTTANTSTSFASISTNWSEVDLTNIGQGVTATTRVGQEIDLRGVRINGVMVGGQTNVALDDNRNIVRIVLALWDTKTATPCQTNGVTLSALLNNKVPSGTGLIKKYMDRIITLNSPGRDSTGYMPAQRYIKIYKRLARKIKYSTTAGTTAQTKLVLSMLSDSVAVPNPGFVSGDLSVYFDDA